MVSNEKAIVDMKEKMAKLGIVVSEEDSEETPEEEGEETDKVIESADTGAGFQIYSDYNSDEAKAKYKRLCR